MPVCLSDRKVGSSNQLFPSVPGGGRGWIGEGGVDRGGEGADEGRGRGREGVDRGREGGGRGRGGADGGGARGGRDIV